MLRRQPSDIIRETYGETELQVLLGRQDYGHHAFQLGLLAGSLVVPSQLGNIYRFWREGHQNLVAPRRKIVESMGTSSISLCSHTHPHENPRPSIGLYATPAEVQKATEMTIEWELGVVLAKALMVETDEVRFLSIAGSGPRVLQALGLPYDPFARYGQYGYVPGGVVQPIPEGARVRIEDVEWTPTGIRIEISNMRPLP